MTTLFIQVEDACPGGCHLSVGLTVDGQKRMVRMDRDEVTAPLSQEDIEAATKTLMRLYARGKQNVSQGLRTGFTVTV